jgi:hypothetical protein
MELEAEILERARGYGSLSRWERSELGRELRRLGLSYGEIMELIPVKKSTLANWCRDIELSEGQIEGIKERRAPEPGIPRNTNRKRIAEIKTLRAIARDVAEEYFDNSQWVSGVVLYWAEGAKTRNSFSMANTDPRALRLFIRWVRTFIDPSARFSIALHLHEGNDEAAAKAYWRHETGLLRANFHKTFIKPKGTGHRKNHLEHGICTVKMRKPSDAWNVVMEWIDAFADHFGLAHTQN